MRRQQGQEERPPWSPGLVAGPHDRAREEGEESDPSITGGFEMDYEDDRFSTDHDDRAGRRWRINSGLDDERDQRRRDIDDVDDMTDETERGVFHTRPTSTTPQDRDRYGRFTAQEPPTWSHWERDGRRDRMRQPGRYDDGSPLRPTNERMSRGRQAGGRGAMDRPAYGASDDDGPARGMRGRDERYLPFANDSYRGRDTRDMVRGRELRDAPFANDSYRNVGSRSGRPFDEPRFDEPRGRRFDEHEPRRRRFDEQRFDEHPGRRYEPRDDEPRGRRFVEPRFDEQRFDDRREPRFEPQHGRRFDEQRRFDERRFDEQRRFDDHHGRRFDEPRRYDERRRFDEHHGRRFDEPRYAEERDPHFDHGRRSPDHADALGYGVYRRRHEHPGDRRRFDERGPDVRRRLDDLRFDQEHRFDRHWTDERDRHAHAPPDELGFHRGSPPQHD